MVKKRQHERASEEAPESMPESPAPAMAEIEKEPSAIVEPAEAEKESSAAAPKALDMPKLAEKFEVMAEKIFSYKGQFITLHKGDIIEPASYGPTFASVLADVGVELRKVAS